MWTVVHLADDGPDDEEVVSLTAVQAISFDIMQTPHNPTPEYFANQYIRMASELKTRDKLVVIEHKHEGQANDITTFTLVPPKKEWTVKLEAN